MRLQTLHDLYIHELQDLHSAGMQLKTALPRAIRAAVSDDLKESLKNHLETEKLHVERLNTILKKHGSKREDEKCRGMEGLIREYAGILSNDACDEIYDLGIIAACQRVVHYEIAGYGTARAYAERLGEEEDAILLAETLEEESTADDELSSIAIMLQSQCEITSGEYASHECGGSGTHRTRKRKAAMAH